MCDPENADTVEECTEFYCDYQAQLEGATEDAELLACLQTEETMLRCVVALSCEDYLLFYSEEDSEPCLAEYRAYETACAPFSWRTRASKPLECLCTDAGYGLAGQCVFSQSRMAGHTSVEAQRPSTGSMCP